MGTELPYLAVIIGGFAVAPRPRASSFPFRPVSLLWYALVDLTVHSWLRL